MTRADRPVIWVVDDDEDVRDGLALLLRASGYGVETCAGGEELLARLPEEAPGCILLDVRMPGMSGLEAQQALARREGAPPIVFLSGHGDVPMVVRAMRGGAHDFLEKPAREADLLAAVEKALAADRARRRAGTRTARIRRLVASLSAREAEVADLLVEGLRTPEMAVRLGLSPRTVEMHRARLLRRLGARTPAEAARIVQAARTA
jgi:FixJ family two-component response regulator